MLNPPSFVAEIRTADGLERRRLAGISISNNPLDEGHLPIPDRLDRGVLGIYLVKPLNGRDLGQLGFGLLRGKFRSLPQVIDKESAEATIAFPRRKASAVAALDGELIPLPDQMVFKIIPGGLRVVVPTESAGRVAATVAAATD